MNWRSKLFSGDWAIRAVLLAALWWLLVQGRNDAWLVGLPAIVLAAFASRFFSPRYLPRISLTGLGRFLMLFVRESLRGGIDVATRTLKINIAIQPGFRTFTLHLTEPSARVFMVNCISLLPGTLSVELKGDQLELHLLDTQSDAEAQLRELEDVIGHLFNLRGVAQHG